MNEENAAVTVQNAVQEAAPQPGNAGLPAEGGTLLTRTDAGESRAGEPAEKAQGEEALSAQRSEDKGDSALFAAPESPEGYELTFAEGVSVDEALLGDFKKTAHSLGITRDQAAKLANFYAGYATKTGERAQVEREKYLTEAVNGWESEIKSSPSFTADKVHAQRALALYGNPELFKVIDQTLIGSHPAMFKFMTAIGKALGEPGIKGSPGGGVKSAAEVLYPNHK